MDKIFTGLTAGIIAATIKNFINLILYYFNLTEVKFLEWGGLIMLGRKPEILPEFIYGLVIHILWTGFLGIIFYYIMPLIKPQGLILKGGLYAFLLTFIFKSIVFLYDINYLKEVSFQTSLLNIITAFTWGIFLVLIIWFHCEK